MDGAVDVAGNSCGEDIYGDARLGTPDRPKFERAIDEYIALHGSGDTAVGLIDIDQFTEISARSGNDYGDTLLLSMAWRLCRLFGNLCLVGRVGTDTFGVVGGTEQITHERLETVGAKPFNIGDQSCVITVSIGVARASECEENGSAVLLAASLAMKTAKANGCGGRAYYSRKLGTEARRRSQLLETLHSAIDKDELFLTFQPQLSLATNQVVGLEALLRWRLPSGEIVLPDAFLPLVEQSGLAVSLGYQILSWALQVGHRLRAQGFEPLRMAVNVSIPQFRDPEFVATVQRALRETGSLPEHLELEITESVAGLGERHLIDVLTKIRDIGVAIAIDDFGTGYSSLAYVDRLPADRLKVDRSFISSLGSGRAESCIAKTIMSMGRELGWTVLAEGVETSAQVDILRELGCDEVQGFFFGRPMVEADLVTWWRQHTMAAKNQSPGTIPILGNYDPTNGLCLST